MHGMIILLLAGWGASEDPSGTSWGESDKHEPPSSSSSQPTTAPSDSTWPSEKVRHSFLNFVEKQSITNKIFFCTIVNNYVNCKHSNSLESMFQTGRTAHRSYIGGVPMEEQLRRTAQYGSIRHQHNLQARGTIRCSGPQTTSVHPGVLELPLVYINVDRVRSVYVIVIVWVWFLANPIK